MSVGAATVGGTGVSVGAAAVGGTGVSVAMGVSACGNGVSGAAGVSVGGGVTSATVGFAGNGVAVAAAATVALAVSFGACVVCSAAGALPQAVKTSRINNKKARCRKFRMMFSSPDPFY